jgi:DNA-binding transcriptional ArsR family regulator
MTAEQASELEGIFKSLGNATRLRILHALSRSGEMCVSEIAGALGMRPTAVSNQLRLLADRAVLQARRDGNQIFYRVIDPCVVKLLDSGWCLAEEARGLRRGRGRSRR